VIPHEFHCLETVQAILCRPGFAGIQAWRTLDEENFGLFWFRDSAIKTFGLYIVTHISP